MGINKGILITAFGHPYYAKLAVNLAVSLHLSQDTYPIKLCIDSLSAGGVELNHRRFFSEIEVVDKSFYQIDKKTHWGFMKTKLNQLTPYDHTLYLDTDSLLLPDKNIKTLFDTITEKPVACEARGVVSLRKESGKSNIGNWATVDQVFFMFDYKLIDIPSYLQTSWMAFDNSDVSKSIFTNAEFVCRELIRRKTLANWYGTVPDELCFSLAFGLTGYNIKRDYSLCHFDTNPHRVNIRNIIDNFTLVTFPSAGSDIHQGYQDFYNNLVLMNAGKTSQVMPATIWKKKQSLNRTNPLNFRDRR